MSKYDNIYNYNDVGVNMEDKELMECGLGLCLVVSSTGHIEMWTRVRILACLVKLVIGHKPLPLLLYT